MKFVQRFLGIWLFGLSLVLITDQVMAALSDAQAVNKAGLQRMLSQRIARNFLMIGAGVDAQNAQKDLDTNLATFEQNFSELQDYSKTKELKAQLSKVEQIWFAYRVKAISKPNKELAVEVLKLSEDLLTASEEMVTLIQKSSSVQQAKLVNTSGRQRMLSQRIAKSYLAMYWGVSYPKADQEFNSAMQSYESGLSSLETDPLTTADIKQTLFKVRAQWDFAKSGFKRSEEGKFVPFVIVRTSDTALKQMNELTSLYVQTIQLAMK